MIDADEDVQSGIEILVVEDSTTQADQLADLLRSNGYDVRMEDNGHAALAAVRVRKPTLIVSDIGMPGMDGFALCRELKKDSSLDDIPIILLSAMTSVDDIIKGLDCGADNFIRKPFEKKYLLGRIRYMLANRRFRSADKIQLGMNVRVGGQTHFVTTERQQIFDLLISTYEEAIQMTEELREQKQQIAHAFQSLQGLYGIAEALNPAMSEQEVSEIALERLLDLPGISGGFIQTLNAPRGNFYISAAVNAGVIQRETTCNSCSCVNRFSQGELLAPEVIQHCALLSGRDVVGHLSIPLIAGTKKLGVLNLVGVSGAIFDGEDLEVLVTVGNQIAIALERASLYSKMEVLVQDRTEALRTEQNKLNAVLDTIDALVVLVDPGGRIVTLNPAFQTHLGWQPDELAGQVFWDVLLEPKSAATVRAAFQTLDPGRLASQTQHDWIARDGSVRRIIWSASVLRAPDESVEFLLCAGLDVTELRLVEEQVQYLSNFDVATGLPNRILLSDLVRIAKKKADANDHVMGFFVIRFSRLALVRERLGSHLEQDLLLETARRLKEWAQAGADVARYTEEGFAVVVIRPQGKELAAAARQILATLSQPYLSGEQEILLSPGIGITLYPQDSTSFESLAQGAEAAAARAVSSNMKRYEFYQPELNRGAHERFMLESALRRAVTRDELVLHYQPQVDLRTGRIVAVEALVRWRHPDLGMIYPAAFIGIAEETDLIVSIGEWVLREACSQLKIWHDEGYEDLRISVNLSARQFSDPNLCNLIQSTLEITGISPESLDLELTESLLVNDVEQAVAIFEKLSELGVQASIDDFGTGYAGFGYLKHFPIDVLKIDRSFVREITAKHGSDAAIADAIIAMAHSLGIRVIAEGVETEAQCRLLSGNLCDEIQGFLFSKPLPALKLGALLRTGKTLPERLLREHRPERTLLLVDDEPARVSALRRQFRKEGYATLTSSSGEEGLSVLTANKVDVVISVQHLPGMTGVEFSRAVKALYADTMRLVLCGFNELRSVTEAVNEGAIHKFLTNPWRDEQLLHHIAAAFQHKELVDVNRCLSTQVKMANQELARASRRMGQQIKNTHGL